MDTSLRNSLLLTTLAILCSPLGLAAQEAVDLKSDSYGQSPAHHEWTAEDYRDAVPTTIFEGVEIDHRAIQDRQNITLEDELTDSESSDSQAPDPTVEIEETQIFEPYPSEDPEDSAREPDADTFNGLIEPRDKGSSNIPYTSSRLRLPKYFPNSTIGKLFYRNDKGTLSACSGAVLGNRVVITAGHCVHSGNGQPSGWHSDFVFMPSFKRGVARNGIWFGTNAWVSGNWYNGNGDVNTPNDFALIVVADNNIGGTMTSLGDVTGWLGWRTFRLANNHIHAAGYPANLDNGEFPNQVASNTQNYNADYWMFGNDMTNGSSGAAMIQNFGAVADGRVPTGNGFGDANSVVGVLHGGPIDNSGPRVGFGSQLNNAFTNLWDSVCGSGDGKNCR